MKMIDSYVTKYNFDVQRKVMPNEKIAIKINIKSKLLKPEEKNNQIYAGIELNNEITFNNNEKSENVGKIDTSITGIFTFDINTDEKEIQRKLRTDGAGLLNQQLRTYINASTAISGALPNMSLPILNFEEKENHE